MVIKSIEKQARILTPQELDQLSQRLPASWVRAAVFLQHKRQALYTHLRRVRKEWDRDSTRV